MLSDHGHYECIILLQHSGIQQDRKGLGQSRPVTTEVHMELLSFMMSQIK